MALRAILERIDFLDDATAHVYVVVTDDIQKAQVDFLTSSLDNLKARARTILTNIEQTTSLKSLHAGDVLDLDPPTPDPEDVARQEFMVSYSQLLSAQRKIAAGLIKADDAAYLALVDATLKLYKDKYLGVG